jgi:predicted lipid-binding transport protein (Tim44 family)
MNYRKLLSFLFVIVVTITTIHFLPDDALARAGGGGGGKGGGILQIIFLPFILAYAAIVTYLVNKKNKESKQLLEQIAKLDDSWVLTKIKARIEVSFFKIQEAWMERNQDIAKEYMSERLYTKHKTQTDQHLKDNTQNILKNINLKSARIVEVADFEDDSKDSIWAYIKGSMIDYSINTETKTVVSGDKHEAENFSELWKFIKNKKNEWVLDEIDQDVSILDLKSMKSFSEDI